MLAWWYKELATSKLFIHMLMSANYADRMWNDILVLRGSLVSSIRSLSSETGLSERQVRTALIHLEDKGEIKKNPDLHTAPKQSIIKSLQIRSDIDEQSEQIKETNTVG
jgi:hypothetical protein